ncbi:MAG: hypothetical protein UY41_C0029G0005 [Candidatus Moranbacteria bacterium GW2011_GWE1_49_15]|nr:MAG: hypothetical protein UX75_C0033G0004 [Candidatus Moranbacteria bacterium GW2011_GWE2_47_10]KKW06330.1 MAG: hypothetical protein UY41_C0029G0005 [Candidatus Moranbacteria bacterium GW2011_GWE1_49_15]
MKKKIFKLKNIFFVGILAAAILPMYSAIGITAPSRSGTVMTTQTNPDGSISVVPSQNLTAPVAPSVAQQQQGATATVAQTPTTTTAPVLGADVGQAAATLNAEFENPLDFNNVEEFLLHFLTYLQRIIVVLALVAVVVGAIMYITSGGDSGRVETAKSTVTSAMIGLAIAIAAPSFLREISIIMGWGNTADVCAQIADQAQKQACLEANGMVDGALSLTQIAMNLLRFLLSIVGVLSLIMLIIGGGMYVTSAGDEDRIDKGKNIIKYSIIGIIVALSSMVVLKQIAVLLAR